MLAMLSRFAIGILFWSFLVSSVLFTAGGSLFSWRLVEFDIGVPVFRMHIVGRCVPSEVMRCRGRLSGTAARCAAGAMGN